MKKKVFQNLPNRHWMLYMVATIDVTNYSVQCIDLM